MDRTWIERMSRRMAAIGKSEEGFERAAYSCADWEAKLLLADEMKEMGLHVSFDTAGNLIGRLEGSLPGAPALVVGGYTDTVSLWGHYDSSVGVISAIGAVRRVMAKGTPKNPLEIWIFAGHEASCFGFAHLGSRSICALPEAENGGHDGEKDMALTVALRLRGLESGGISVCRRETGEVKAFAELHIGRESVPAAAEFRLGIVTDIAKPVQLAVKVMEQSGYAEDTPLKIRHDALAAAADIVLAVRRQAAVQENEMNAAAAGRLTIKPVRMNVVPGEAELCLEIQTGKLWLASAAIDKISREVKAAARAKGVGLTIEMVSPLHPLHLSDKLIHTAECFCKSQNIPYDFTVSNRCDAQEIARKFPAIVFQAPSRKNRELLQDKAVMIDDIVKASDALAGFIESCFDS